MSLFPSPFVLDMGAVAGTDVFRNGIRLTQAGAVRAALAAGGSQSPGHSGLRFSTTGQLIVVDASAGLPAGTQWVGGLPVTSLGELCVSQSAAVVWANGIGFAASGGVAGSGLSWVPAGAAVALDFVNDRYYWDGVQKSWTDLTRNGTVSRDATGASMGATGSIRIPSTAWYNANEITVVSEVYQPFPSAAEECIFSFGANFGPERFEHTLFAKNRGHIYINTSGNVDSQYGDGSTFTRQAVSFKNATPTLVAMNGPIIGSIGNGFTLGGAGNNLIGLRQFADDMRFTGKIRTLTLYSSALLAAPLQTIMSESQRTGLHLLGDSFVNNYDDTDNSTARAFRILMNDYYRVLSMDGVGSTSLAQCATRYAASSADIRGRTVIIMDGGLDGDAASNIAALQSIIANNTSGRWLYMQPSPADMIAGSGARTTWDATQAAILNFITTNYNANRYVDCLTALKAANDGSANDLADVANNIVPRSLRLPGDIIHETNAGALIRDAQLYNRVTSLGW